ncbi:B12-binding domain-containing radical SAM protein [Candidatus Latescibacterota bacterium]
MNVLLVYPGFPDTFWSFKHALKFIRKKAALPPLGLLTVGAMLPPEWSKRLVDVNVAPLEPEDLAWADLAMISSMSVQQQSALETIDRCKEAKVPVVAGGPLFTGEPGRFAHVDHLVLNEAEVTLPPFLDDLERGCARHCYTTDQYPDIRQTPVPLWQLADLGKYASMSVQFSRGCPYHCEFCNVTALFGHRPRTKTADQIISELDGLRAAGWRGRVFFVDDNLIGNKRALKTELLPALIDWQRHQGSMSFYTEASINLADDPALMEMMVEAGFNMVFVGIETPDEVSLAECSKSQNLDRDLVGDVKRIQRAGLQVQGGFIVGFDNDTPSIFQRQIDFIQKSGVVTAMVGLLTALPGTRLHDRLRQAGRLAGQLSGDNVDGTTNIIPRLMDLATLQSGYRELMHRLYSPEHYYGRLRTFLRDYHPPRVHGHLDLQHVLALFRSFYHLGIVGRERLHYWRLLLWTSLHRPRFLPLAVTLAIYGHHFRRVCEAHIS